MRTLLSTWIFFLVCALYWVNGSRRRLLKKRSPADPRRCLYALARNVAAMLCSPRASDIEIRGSLAPGVSGAVMYSLHYGAWELMPQILRRTGHRIGIITNRYGPGLKFHAADLADRILRRWRSRNGVTVFYRNDPRRIVEFIKDGGIFAMLVDGSERYDKYPAARKLASVCNVPLVPFAVYRSGRGGVLEIGCDLENLIRRRPQDYLWFYRSRRGAA